MLINMLVKLYMKPNLREKIAFGLDYEIIILTIKALRKDSIMEKYSVIYSSRTGNTKVLAEQVKKIFGAQNNIYFKEIRSVFNERQKLDILDSCDILFLGFWTAQGTCDEEMKELLKKVTYKKIYLFGTAGFGTDVKYFNKIIDTVKSNIDKSNEIMGHFMCQGRMPMSVKKRYDELLSNNPEDEKSQIMIRNYYDALKHPSEKDLDSFEIDLKKRFSI